MNRFRDDASLGASEAPTSDRWVEFEPESGSAQTCGKIAAYVVSGKIGMDYRLTSPRLETYSAGRNAVSEVNSILETYLHDPPTRDHGWWIEHRYPSFHAAEHLGLAPFRHRLKESLQATAEVEPDVEVRREFERNRDIWKSKKKYLSSLTEIVLIPEYQRIIGLGRPALPLIIESLRNSVDHWFWALRAIVGEDHGGGAETMNGAAEQWIAWFDSAYA